MEENKMPFGMLKYVAVLEMCLSLKMCGMGNYAFLDSFHEIWFYSLVWVCGLTVLRIGTCSLTSSFSRIEIRINRVTYSHA
ncbi:hypothetical protein F8388_023138 [Cannabis sativa]|uniref:Uncharacterized protein n=1 Tax=Cannabis sativa TaxID=3483 RepID=A0A7J6HDI3_CANSA|nr:hypothetical protein F8388_018230 [Cannabis sativa]KAF4393334.1 hypothetical protein F8388_023138 [Cannabis sativa]